MRKSVFVLYRPCPKWARIFYLSNSILFSEDFLQFLFDVLSAQATLQYPAVWGKEDDVRDAVDAVRAGLLHRDAEELRVRDVEPFDGLLGIFLIVPADQTEHLKLVAASPRRPLFCIVPSGAKRIISGMKSFVAEESQDEQQEDDSKCC